MDLSEQIRELVEGLYELDAQYLRSKKWDSQVSRPNPPAAGHKLREIEAQLGRALPEDYRTFLELYDGWSKFSGGYDLLSADQLLGRDARMLESIQDTKGLMRQAGDERAALGFVILASKTGPRVVYFDMAKKRTDNALDLVQWEYKPDARYRSFLAFLKRQFQISKLILIEEQAMKRPAKRRK